MCGNKQEYIIDKQYFLFFYFDLLKAKAMRDDKLF